MYTLGWKVWQVDYLGLTISRVKELVEAPPAAFELIRINSNSARLTNGVAHGRETSCWTTAVP
jgi:hypothetical protein